MANKNLFRSLFGRGLPRAAARNREGAPAYEYTPGHALAQYAATGCLHGTFYADASLQLETVLGLCEDIDPSFVAKTAVYAREHGHMKDMPALLLAVLSVKDGAALEAIFDRVVDNGRMLRTFVQVLRSGVVGRKSLGSRPKRLVRRWLEGRGDRALFRASVGNDPSLADIVRMVHPKPASKEREAFYGWLLGREFDAERLPAPVRRFEDYKAGRTRDVPDVPFQLLTALPLGPAEWSTLASNGGWHMVRMNLNTFLRNGVFEREGMAQRIAHRLRDAEAIANAKVFPYQLLAAYRHTRAEIPGVVRDALHDAVDVAVANVPRLPGKVHVLVDVSGSMSSPVTGYRRGASSKVRCVDVAALFAAAVLRKNPDAEVLAFDGEVYRPKLSARASVFDNADRLRRLGGGGTSCSAPLRKLNRHRKRGDLVVFVSDNQSWLDSGHSWDATATMREWNVFQRRNPAAKLACIDITPYGTTQAHEREDILNVGGFSDRVFDVVALFARNELDADHWVGVIDKIEI